MYTPRQAHCSLMCFYAHDSVDCSRVLNQLQVFYGKQEACWPSDSYLFLLLWYCGYRASALVPQGKCHNFVGRAATKEASASCGNHYKLLAALLSHVGNGRSMRAGGQLCRPQLLSGSRVKGPKTPVCCRPDKNQPARGRDGAPKVWRAGFPIQAIDQA